MAYIPKEEWMRIINEQESSELSISQYCSLKLQSGVQIVFIQEKIKLNIHINSDTLLENKGRVDFKPYVINRYSYNDMKTTNEY